MKKLICALVLLAMLVPVAAMAEGGPAPMPQGLPLESLESLSDEEIAALNVQISTYKVRRMRTSVDANDTNKTYTGFYYLTGALDSVMVTYNHGSNGPESCVAEFGPTGELEMIQQNCSDAHDFTAPVEVELASGKDAITPAANVYDVAEAYGWDESDGDFLTKIKEAYNTGIEIEGNSVGIKPVGDTKFDMSHMGGNKQFAHFGPIVYGYHPSNGTRLRVYGDKNKNTLSWADYDVLTGELDHYGIFTEDGRMETVYSAKNVLISTEIWTDDGAYWRYEGDDWLYSAEGDPESDGWGATPSAEVLEMITLSPRKATFTVDGSKGTPKVPGSVSAETEVTMLDSHRTEFIMTTTDGDNLKEPITLLLPYGAGQNRAIAEQFTYTVVHEPEDKPKETYCTEPTSASQIKMTFTDDGVELTGVSSFSPFTVEWGPKQASTVGMDSLPSTGDSSNLLAYACLLLSSAAALYMISKRRAHQ